MIDTNTETLLPLAAAAKQLPCLRRDKRGRPRPVSPATLWRWINPGLRGVQLEALKVGGTTCTSREALSRFFAALSAPPVSPPARDREQERVERELAEIGI